MLQWASYNGVRDREVEPIPKGALSSDCRLQLACMKPESLVTAGQLNGGEYVPGPCTHRPSSHLNCLHPKPVAEPGACPGTEPSKVWGVRGTKS